MTRDEDVLRQALSWLDGGREVALATVLSTWGSSLRPPGSQLAVSDGLELAGSVSGGCVEAAVAEAAQRVIREGAPQRLRFGVADDRAWEVGLACGGTVEVLVARAEREVVAGAVQAAEARHPVVIVTEIASGATTLLDPGVPGDHPLASAAREALAGEASRLFEGPAGPAFLQVLNPPVRVIVVGAVHIAQALAPCSGWRGTTSPLSIREPRSPPKPASLVFAWCTPGPKQPWRVNGSTGGPRW